MSAPRAEAQVVKKEVKLSPRALGENLYAPIDAVAHPTCQPQPSALVEGGGSIPHPLHATANDGVKTLFLRRRTIFRHNLRGSLQARAALP